MKLIKVYVGDNDINIYCNSIECEELVHYA